MALERRTAVEVELAQVDHKVERVRLRVPWPLVVVVAVAVADNSA